MKDCPFSYQTFVTGSTPNHVPATVAFIFGGASGFFGIVLLRPRSTTATRNKLLAPN